MAKKRTNKKKAKSNKKRLSSVQLMQQAKSTQVKKQSLTSNTLVSKLANIDTSRLPSLASGIVNHHISKVTSMISAESVDDLSQEDIDFANIGKGMGLLGKQKGKAEKYVYAMSLINRICKLNGVAL